MNLNTRAARQGLVSILTTVAVLSGCAGTVSRPVAEDNRDTTGQYDGTWNASITSKGGVQEIERWSFKCAAQDFAFDLVVADGLIKFANDGDNEKLASDTYVDVDGRFRLELPLDAKARASGGSDQQISDGAITVILEGELSGDEPKGFYTAGIAEFLNRGCRYPVKYEARG